MNIQKKIKKIIEMEEWKNRRLEDVYSSADSLMKVLYLSTKKVTKNWAYTQPEWGETLKELEIIFEGRI